MRFDFILSLLPLALASSLSISGPDVISSCTPATYTWTPTFPPYTLSIIDHSAYLGPLEEVNTEIPAASTATWIVDVRPGRNVSVALTDAEGNTVETRPTVVGEGKFGCLS